MTKRFASVCFSVDGLGLAEDDQDSVRLQTVDNCSALARVLNEEGQEQHVLPIVLETTKDQ